MNFSNALTYLQSGYFIRRQHPSTQFEFGVRGGDSRNPRRLASRRGRLENWHLNYPAPSTEDLLATDWVCTSGNSVRIMDEALPGTSSFQTALRRLKAGGRVRRHWSPWIELRGSNFFCPDEWYRPVGTTPYPINLNGEDILSQDWEMVHSWPTYPSLYYIEGNLLEDYEFAPGVCNPTTVEAPKGLPSEEPRLDRYSLILKNLD